MIVSYSPIQDWWKPCDKIERSGKKPENGPWVKIVLPIQHSELRND